MPVNAKRGGNERTGPELRYGARFWVCVGAFERASAAAGDARKTLAASRDGGDLRASSRKRQNDARTSGLKDLAVLLECAEHNGVLKRPRRRREWQ